MTLVALGSMSVGAAVPGAAAAVSAGVSGCNGGLPNLLSQLNALLAYVPQAIDFSAQLAVAQQTFDGIDAAIKMGITPPSVDAQAALIAQQVAALQLVVTGINAQLDVLLALQAPLAAAGVYGYAYDGALDEFGNELDDELSASSGHANAVVLLTTIPETWDAMSVILKVTP